MSQHVPIQASVINPATEKAMSAGDSNFEALLAGLLSHDNAVRKNAENVYNQELETQPAVVVGQLLKCLTNGQVGSRTSVMQAR